MGEKERREREAFKHFASLSGLHIVPDTVKKREKPDISCEVEGFGGAREKVGFELMELVDERIKELEKLPGRFSNQVRDWKDGKRKKQPQFTLQKRKKRKSRSANKPVYMASLTAEIWDQNDLVKDIMDKFEKSYEYESGFPNELIVYDMGTNVLPVDVMVPTIGEYLVKCRTFGMFRKVWFLSLRAGERFCQDMSAIALERRAKMDKVRPGEDYCAFCIKPLGIVKQEGTGTHFCSELCSDRKQKGWDWMPPTLENSELYQLGLKYL